MVALSPQAREHATARILYATRRKRSVPLQARKASLMRRAVAWAYPQAYPGIGLYASLCGLLSCSVGSLRHWLMGRREMPERVRLILIQTIRNRLESGAAVLAELEHAKRPERNNAASLNGAKARKAKAADDAANQALKP